MAAALIASVVGIAGCSASTAELSSELSGEWQARVVTIADLAAAGDNAAALAQLDLLDADARDARASRTITAERAALIQQSIDIVRADLQPTPVVSEETSAPAATPEPAEVVETEQPSAPDTQTDSDQSSEPDRPSEPEQTAPPQQSSEPEQSTPDPAETIDDGAPGNGPGKGKGEGNSKGKGNRDE